MHALFCAGLLVLAADVTPLPDDFLLIAHRGVVTDELIENSLPALEETIRRGYTHIEVDMRCTKDGHAVCLHASSLRRTTGVDRQIHEVTLEELRELIDEETVPSLETFCARASGRIGLMPDVKTVPVELNEAFFVSIESAMTKHGLMKGALFIGHPLMKQRVGEGARVSWRGPLDKAQEKAAEEPGFAQRTFLFGHGEDFSAENVAGYQALGLPVIVSVNTFHYRAGDPIEAGLAHVIQMMHLGVDGLQIDSVYDPPILERMPHAATP